MLRKEEIEKMMDKTVRIIDDLQGHTVDECLHMLAAVMGVLVLGEKDFQNREQMLKEFIDIVRSSVYESGDTEVVYVDRVIEE
tara:strand:- start:290 stop:538 length:249 start_codon:yes stop_codon:yes gene_type:complete